MKIAIDTRPFTHNIMGIGNFLKLAIFNMANERKDIKIYLLTPSGFHKTFNADFPTNVEIIKCPLLSIFHVPNLFWFLLKVPFMLRRLNIDVFYSPTPTLPFFIKKNILKVITVHDVVGIEFAKTMEFRNKVSSTLMFNRSIKTADIIWANSEYTKEKIQNYFPQRKSEDIFVGCSIDEEQFKEIKLSSTEIQFLKKKYGINDAFILFVGSLEPRKNISYLLSLMPKLYSEYNIQLLVVGGKGWRNSSIFSIVNNPAYPKESTIFAGYVELEELVKLYNIANCYVSTSLNEGFGMPQLEALFCKCPVVTANNSAMVEVVRNYGSLVSGWESEIWIEKIVEKALSLSLQNVDPIREKYCWSVIIKGFFDKVEQHRNSIYFK